MTTAGYRALIALANLLIVSSIFYVGFRTFVGGSGGVTPPKDFDPSEYKVEVTHVKRSEIAQHQVVWDELDPAPPPPPAPVATPNNRPQVNSPQDLSTVYQLLAVGQDVLIVQRRGGSQETYAMGDVMEGGYTIEDISFSGEGDSRVAVVTVQTRGGSSTIRLTREPQR